jgi:hypothetical protein
MRCWPLSMPARLQYTLVLAGHPASWALRVDATRLIPAEEWPCLEYRSRARIAGGAVRSTLLLHAS